MQEKGSMGRAKIDTSQGPTNVVEIERLKFQQVGQIDPVARELL